MWPWEHAIMGYVVYSLFCHVYYRAPPGGLEAFAVVFASVLPDLIDKPLAWQYGIFESGYALGHSIFFAIPLSLAVGLLARSYGRTHAGIAFGFGYLVHLPADIIDGVVRDGYLEFGIVLWPFGSTRGHDHSVSFSEHFFSLLGTYYHELFSGDPSLYILAQFGIGLFAALLWLYDGAPVLRELALGVHRLVVDTVATFR
ncbi:metal-dependent hydrolase [Halostagnicola bangensis]